MSDRAGSEVEVESEGGSDEEQFEEVAERVAEGAVGQAEQETTVPALPEWASGWRGPGSRPRRCRPMSSPPARTLIQW